MIQDMLILLKGLNNDLPVSIKLTDTGILSRVTKIADKILETAPLSVEIEDVEELLSEQKDDFSLIIHLAVKLAKSKKTLQAISEKVHLSIIFAIYKEHQRILTAKKHPNGEDFLHQKIKQINWLFEGKTSFSWDMYLVDDGCPDNSGTIAQKILNERYDKENVKVLFLEDAIEKKVSVAKELRNVDESRKGGSIEYGIWAATQIERPNHIVLYTDADLSIHLGQAGLLINSIINEGKNAAIGSKWKDTSVFLQPGKTNPEEKLFIYLWKRLIPQINYIVDTQCGFNAFTAENARKILPGTIAKQFAFDIELLLKTEIFKHNSISEVAIAGVKSAKALATDDLRSYLDMLKMIANLYFKYIPENDEGDKFAGFIENLTEDDWKNLAENIPEPIKDGNPFEFKVYNGIKVSDLKAILNK